MDTTIAETLGVVAKRLWTVAKCIQTVVSGCNYTSGRKI